MRFAVWFATLSLGLPVMAQWAQIGWERVVSGLKQPTLVTGAGDGSGRVFIVEQPGRVRILRNGALVEKPFLDLTARVGYDKERGLLSVAFPPRFAERKRVYADFTEDDGTIVIARYKVTEDPDVADPASEEVLLRIPQPFGQHNGGMMAFSPVDGMLYISTGDGGIGSNGEGKFVDDPLGNGQNGGTLLAKILRIDTERGDGEYAVPADNPKKPGWLPEIWSTGWRNPWRFSFDRKTGDFYAGDVGADAYEEVNFEPAGEGGRNYGWSLREGRHCLPGRDCGEVEGLTDPVVEYPHSQGCSVTGGVVYRGKQFPELDGTYFYGDFCRGLVWGLKRIGGAWRTVGMGPTGALLVSFGEDDDGEVYAVDYKGVVLRMKQLAPGLTVTSVGNAASYEAGLSAGSLSSIFTAGLPGVTEALGAEEQPLPLTLGGVTVWVNGTQAPLSGVAPGGKVDFLVPYVVPGEKATVQVRAGFNSSNVFEVDVKPLLPGLFSRDGRMAAVVNDQGENTTGAARGAVAALFATGLGPAKNPPEFGYPATDTPGSEAVGKVTATIGGKPAEVQFCALTPGFAGIYTVVVTVPADVEAGEQDVTVAVDGVTSPALRFTVE